MMMTDREKHEQSLVNELKTNTSLTAAAEYRSLCLIRELEDVIALPHNQRYASYLAWLCGTSVKTAHERIRVARVLPTLPRIAALFETGRISWSKVRMITRVATPESDHKYADLALHGPVHFLEDVVKHHTQILDDDARVLESRRHFDIYTDEHGMFVVRGRLAPDEGALLKKAIESARTAGAQTACEAIVELATAGIEKLATGDEAVLHVECSDHVCTVEGHACSRATADRLICQNPHRRKASAAQTRILKQLQGGSCAFPACTHTRHLHAHHIKHWSKGGKTVVANLALVCTKHHRALHEGGYSLTRDGHALVFRNHNGVVIPPTGELDGVSTGDKELWNISAVSAADYDPGEYLTNFQNRDFSISWLLSPEP